MWGAITGAFSALGPGAKATIIIVLVLALLLLPVTVLLILLLLVAVAIVAIVRTRSAGSSTERAQPHLDPGVRLRDVFSATCLRADGGGPSGAVSLLGARIGGLPDLLGGTVCSRSNPRLRWEIDGLTYTRIPRLALKRTGRPGWSCWAVAPPRMRRSRTSSSPPPTGPRGTTATSGRS